MEGGHSEFQPEILVLTLVKSQGKYHLDILLQLFRHLDFAAGPGGGGAGWGCLFTTMILGPKLVNSVRTTSVAKTSSLKAERFLYF